MLNLPAALLMSASLLSPIRNLAHVSKVIPADQRIDFTLVNTTPRFVDLKIGNQTYTVLTKRYLYIKAPAGTVVYAASRFDDFHRGDAVLTVTSALKESRFDLR